MNAKRWNYLKSLSPPAPRMLWNSAWPNFRGTYNAGKNAAKRSRRAQQ